MPALDLSSLINATTAAEGTDASAVVFINGAAAAYKAAVAAAIAATTALDAAASDAANASAQTAIDGVTARLVAAATPVADALVANPLPGDLPPTP